MITKISNGKIISGDNIITEKSLYIRDGKILCVSGVLPADKEIDAAELKSGQVSGLQSGHASEITKGAGDSVEE